MSHLDERALAAAHADADMARRDAAAYFTEVWAPAMAYPRAGAAMHVNATHQPEVALANTWVPPNEISNYQAGQDTKPHHTRR